MLRLASAAPGAGRYVSFRPTLHAVGRKAIPVPAKARARRPRGGSNAPRPASRCRAGARHLRARRAPPHLDRRGTHAAVGRVNAHDASRGRRCGDGLPEATPSGKGAQGPTARRGVRWRSSPALVVPTTTSRRVSDMATSSSYTMPARLVAEAERVVRCGSTHGASRPANSFFCAHA